MAFAQSKEQYELSGAEFVVFLFAMKFHIVSDFKPTGINQRPLTARGGIGKPWSISNLIGRYWVWKNLTVANVIEKVQRPTLVLAHNKTRRAVVCGVQAVFSWKCCWVFCIVLRLLSARGLYPHNGNLYRKGLVIKKKSKNSDRTTSSLLSGRRDVLVVASVLACRDWNPIEFRKRHRVEVGQVIARTAFLHRLVQSLYARTTADFYMELFVSKEIL